MEYLYDNKKRSHNVDEIIDALTDEYVVNDDFDEEDFSCYIYANWDMEIIENDYDNDILSYIYNLYEERQHQISFMNE